MAWQRWIGECECGYGEFPGREWALRQGLGLQKGLGSGGRLGGEGEGKASQAQRLTVLSLFRRWCQVGGLE